MTTYANSEAGWSMRSTRPLPLSPEQVRRANLTRTPLGRRGYDEHDVHALLNRVAAELESAHTEQATLRDENARLKEAMKQWHARQTRSQGAAAANGSSELAVRQSAVQVMSRAQREADKVVADAQNYARLVVEHARNQHDEILREGYQQAQLAAEMAARRYRAEAGSSYRADLEELERHLTWAQTFIAAIDSAENMIRAARLGLTHELRRIREAQDSD
jgi:cell division initiation protein